MDPNPIQLIAIGANLSAIGIYLYLIPGAIRRRKERMKLTRESRAIQAEIAKYWGITLEGYE